MSSFPLTNSIILPRWAHCTTNPFLCIVRDPGFAESMSLGGVLFSKCRTVVRVVGVANFYWKSGFIVFCCFSEILRFPVLPTVTQNRNRKADRWCSYENPQRKTYHSQPCLRRILGLCEHEVEGEQLGCAVATSHVGVGLGSGSYPERAPTHTRTANHSKPK